MKKYLFFGIAAVVIIFIVFQVFGFAGTPGDIPITTVSTGNFIVSLSENGRLNAQRSVTISAPRIRGGLQIVKLADEGTMVQEGDFLVQFDPTDREADLRDAESELKMAKANLEQAKAKYEMDMVQLELELKKAERNFAEKQSEAPIIRKEAELELELAQLKFETQKRVLAADIEKMEVEVAKATDNRDQAQRDLAKMTVSAPIPGLVVYLEIWKGGQNEKVQEGDSPWGGQGLINLPDLSTMIVETTVSEVDVSKIKLGQKALIRLDAIPGPIFTGTVTDISTLARRKERSSQINVFDVEILIDSSDSRLKPGMSAKVDIIIDEFDDVLAVPLEAVFERDDTTIVYSADGDRIPVALGNRNDHSVIVTSGLDAGDRVRLVDPTKKIDEEELAPKTEEASPNKANGRRGGGTRAVMGG